METIQELPSLYSKEDFLQLFQMEQLSERFTQELKNGCVYVVTALNVESTDKVAKSYLIATKETKTTITQDELSVINNAITLLHLDDWMFEATKNNTRHIRIIAINDRIHFQAIEAGKDTLEMNVEGSGVYSVIWGTFVDCLGSLAAEALRDYEAYAQEWRKNQS